MNRRTETAAHSDDTAGPFAFDGHAAFEGKAELNEELNGGINVFHHDADIVHTLDCHDVSCIRCLFVKRGIFSACVVKWLCSLPLK
jgi:hypothetical protein